MHWVRSNSIMERYGRNIQYKSHEERYTKDVKYKSNNEKDMDSDENEGSKLNGTPRCHPGKFSVSVTEKEYRHLTGCVDDGTKLSTYGTFVTTASGDMVCGVRHSLQCEFAEN